MKTTFIIILTLSISFSYGQTYKKVASEQDTFYLLTNYDTIKFNYNLPSGRWKIFNREDTTLIEYVFNVKDKKVSGPFFHNYLNGTYSYGNYFNDSLWTFLFNPKDTTFKVGYWVTAHSQGWTDRQQFKIIFDKADSIFKEEWYYQNGQIAFQRKTKKDFGVTEETWWYFDTKNISSKQINKPYYSQYTSYTPTDSIAVNSIKQDIEIIDILKSDFGKSITVQKNIDSLIAMVRLDKSYNVDGFSDFKNHIKIDYYDNGTAIISYLNYKGKYKTKKIRLKK